MATNVVVYDLEDYPDNSKTVVTDQKLVTPVGYEGDEQWVSSFVTTAYSSIANRTAIQDIYIQEIKGGWLKSSGFVGTAGKFTIGSSSKKLKIKLDNSTGAVDGEGYYTITLDEGTNLKGEAVAEDMEKKIRALSLVDADSGYSLTYMNATVVYEGGRFWIISGSISAYYTGAARSSVKVAQSGTDTCYQTLGFNLPIDSQTIAETAIEEALLASDYIADATPLAINAGITVTEGDCLMITDGVNKDYFTAISGTTNTSVAVCTFNPNAYTGIDHNYATSSGTKVQVLREQDPEQAPVAYYDTIDRAVRFGIKSITNQIDFSA